MVGELKIRVKPWNDNNNRSLILEIINARNKYTNPDFAVELKENAIDNWFGKDTALSHDLLQFENKGGKIVGFAGLTTYSDGVKTHRVIHAILPEYFQTELPRLVIESAVELGKKQGMSKLIFSIFGSASVPFEKVMIEKGIDPSVYVYDMELSGIESTFHQKTPQNIVFQESSGLEDYGEYIHVINEGFQRTFEFSESTIEDVKKHVELVTSHGLDYMHCLAFLSRSLVGVCNYYFYPKEFKGVIESISILPSHQHQEIGSALLSYCVESMRKKGSKKIMVTVRVENKRSLKFFERFGFISDDNRVQKYYQIL